MRPTTLLLAFLLLAPAFPADPPPPPILGDYDSELRLPDGHVDLDLMIRRLQDLHANTYFWLIWHKPTDWEDLQSFLPKAAAANIKVWAYLVPWSESGFGGLYSEPYRTDFVRWAQEIGKLSRRCPNLVGYVIDDFWTNFALAPRPDGSGFTPDLLTKMAQAARAENPDLKFYPLMYYPQLGLRFATTLAPHIDGVVAAYPRDKAEIEQALRYLSEDYLTSGGCWTMYPPGTPSAPGDYASLSQTADVTDPRFATIRFDYQDDYDGPTAGYHVMQLRVDGKVVWSEDVGGRDDNTVLIDLAPYVGVKPSVRLSLGVWDLKGVSEFAVQVAFSNLKVTGLRLATVDLGKPIGWELNSKGPFFMECRAPQGKRPRLPLIVMPAGSRGEYKNRFKEDATPENIAARLKQATDLAREGKVEGVVIYCLDKTENSPDLPAAAAVFKSQ